MSYKKKGRERDCWEHGNAEVIVRSPNDLERSIKKLRKMMKENGILEEYKERMYYTKPSDKKRRKKALSKYRSQKLNK